MDTILSLWLPILVSAVLVFFASFVTWALLPFHGAEYKAIPDEEFFQDALAQRNVASGEYMVPFAGCKSERMKDPAFLERMKTHPMAHVRVWRGMPNMGRNMALTFVVMLIVSALVAYLTSQTVMFGADASRVFQISALVALMGYAFGGMPNGIWFGKSGRAFVLDFIDAIAYALITGAVFAWLWPSASMATPVVPGLGG